MGLFNFFKPKKDPYWDFNESNHFRPRLNKSDFYKLTGFDFGWFVLEPIANYIGNYEGELERGDQMSYGQKALYYWWYVDAQVCNGGFTQYYYNDYGHYSPTAIKALNYIGDTEMADLISRSYELYLKKKNIVMRARYQGMEGFTKLYKKIDSFDDLTDEYLNIHDRTMSRIEAYFRKNANEICLDEDGNEYDTNYSGDLITYYEDKNIKDIIPLKEGVVSGVLKSYYLSGKISEEIHYEAGIRTGDKKEYYENGNLKHSVQKLADKGVFEFYWYYENGNAQKLEYKTIDTNEQVGEFKEWYDNGQLAKAQNFVASYERDGLWLEFYRDGSKKLEAEFKNNELLIHNFWDEDATQTLVNGSGVYKYQYKDWNNIITYYEQEFHNHRKHGKMTGYKNGKLTSLCEMYEGKEHGVYQSFDENGDLKSESFYEHGILKNRKEYKK